MIKKLFSSILFLFISLFWVFPVFAVDDTGTPTSFKITVLKLEMSTDGGTTWIVVFDDSTGTELDLAAVSANTTVGNFVNNTIIPNGTYNAVRITMNQIFKITGTVTSSVANDGGLGTCGGLGSCWGAGRLC